MLSIRKIGVLGRTYRHLNRYRQILTILFRYGFGDFIEMLRIDQYLEVGLQFISKNRKERLEKLSRAEKIRMTIEELGPTYIKLGQILSVRPDLIPPDLVEELSKLQDDVAAVPFADIRHVIENELRCPIEDVFASFDEVPLASASIGQVYRAVLKNGDAAAVKVQRPGIRNIIEVDLEIMLHLATLAEKNIEEMAFYRPVKIVEEFADTLEREIDYTIEASNLERIAVNFIKDSTVYIPKVYRDATTSRVLTMEFIDGIKVSQISCLEECGLDPKEITKRGAEICLKQIFEHGFFHADPHPGNIFILPDNVICLLDFGMVGLVDRQTRENFVELVDSVVHRHEARAAQVLLKVTEWDIEPDMRVLERDIADFIGRHFYRPLKNIRIGPFLKNLLDLTSRHQLRMTPDVFMMLKSLATLEGVAVMLDPDFDIIASAEPFIRRIKMARFHPQRITGDFLYTASDFLEVVQQLPKDLRELSKFIKNRRIPLAIEHQGLESMLHTHDQISNRISFSIVIAALIIGSALIVISETPPYVFGISLIGIIGFLAAALMGIWLLVAILKKGKL
ncbi:MAG: AarF/ABC1/UbiB kinase family protein [Desulfobacterales bacterium]